MTGTHTLRILPGRTRHSPKNRSTKLCSCVLNVRTMSEHRTEYGKAGLGSMQTSLMPPCRIEGSCGRLKILVVE